MPYKMWTTHGEQKVREDSITLEEDYKDRHPRSHISSNLYKLACPNLGEFKRTQGRESTIMDQGTSLEWSKLNLTLRTIHS